MREDLGSGKDVDAGFSCYKVSVKEKNKWSDLTHITTKIFTTESNSYEARKKSSINCFYSLRKLVEELGTEPRQSLVYSVSTRLEELFLPIHSNLIPTNKGRAREPAEEPALTTFC